MNRVFDNARHGYRRLLDGLLAEQWAGTFCAVFFALLAVPFFMLSQKELAPTEDQGEINVAYTAPPEASLEYTERYMTDVVNAMESLPGSDRMWQMVLSNAGFGGMKFTDSDERELSTGEMLTTAFAGLSEVTGLTAFPVLPSALPSAGRFDMEFVVLSSDSPEEMLPHAAALLDRARQTGLFLFVDSDLSIDPAPGPLSARPRPGGRPRHGSRRGGPPARHLPFGQLRQPLRPGRHGLSGHSHGRAYRAPGCRCASRPQAQDAGRRPGPPVCRGPARRDGSAPGAGKVSAEETPSASAGA